MGSTAAEVSSWCGLPEVSVRLPPLDELAERWQDIGPLLLKSTRRAGGAYEPIDLLRGAFAGQFGIWICEVDGGIEAAVVTEIRQYPRRRVLDVIFGGGSNMQKWIDKLVQTIDRHAREAGCEAVVCIGRPGWLKAWGAEPTGNIIMVRRISA